MSLQVDYNRANEIATAACYMGNKTLRIVNQLTMAVTTLMAKQYYPTEKVLTSRIDGQDVCQTLVSEIEEIASWVDFLEDSRKAELRQDPQEIEEVEDPSYQLDSSSEDDSDGDDDESQEEQKVQEKRSLERYMLSTRKTLQSQRMACWGIINSQPHPICVQGNLAFNLSCKPQVWP